MYIFLCFFVLSAAHFAESLPNWRTKHLGFFPKDKRVAVVAHAASRIQTPEKCPPSIPSLSGIGGENIRPRTRFSQSKTMVHHQRHIDAPPNSHFPCTENTEPSPEHLKDIDIVLFDLQDVGVRLHLPPLHLVMEACAESNVPLLLLTGPIQMVIMLTACDGRSIQRVFGDAQYPHRTRPHFGEYAGMINGEGWQRSTAMPH